jgi:hypothetical protein
MDRIYILAIAIVIAGALDGGLYAVSGGSGASHMVNRFAGKTWYCRDHLLPNRFTRSNFKLRHYLISPVAKPSRAEAHLSAAR